ncbi:MAG: PLP-dependent aminotransferase family protein [Kiritimatiellae bacterium]|nr:PLP-dependent aminotransferase family protein [Kiritimatiellia bacterium]
MPVNSFDDHPLPWAPARAALSGGPVYLALAAALEGDIRSRTLAPGAKLPPQRELADYLDIDFTTVTRAYNVCREKGLIHGVKGRGTFVASSAGLVGAEGGLVDCGVVQGFPGIGEDEVLAAARDVFARPSPAGLFSYRDRDGTALSREAGIAWLRRNGVAAKPSQMAVFPGAQGAISAALLALFRVGDAIAADEFTYANFVSLARLAHIRLVPIASDSDGMKPAALDEAAADGRLKGVFLMPHCANPTARNLSERRKGAIAEVVRRRNLILIEDDAALALPGGRERTFFSRLPRQTVHISGATRYIAPGLRVAFMAFPEDRAASLLGALHHIAIKASALDAEIMGEVILSGRAERILRAKCEKARAANALFDEAFPGAPRAVDTSLFRMLPLPGTSGRGSEIEESCRRAGVLVCHSDRFSVRPGNPLSFLRISLSSAPSLSCLRQAFATLPSAVCLSSDRS